MRRPAPSRAHRPRSIGPSARAWLAGVALGLALALLSWSTAADAAAPPKFDDVAEARSQNGALLLSWDADLSIGEREYELEEAGDPSFADAALRYRGTFPSFFISGRPDGARYFRVRSRDYGSDQAWSAWSQPKSVVVEHHDMRLALGLFCAGAAVFLATCTALLIGARRARSRG